jgi:Na+(H+)/acetate symporter ActP
MDLEGYQYVWLIVVFIVGFFAVRIGVGILGCKKLEDALDYVVARRRVPNFMVGR